MSRALGELGGNIAATPPNAAAARGEQSKQGERNNMKHNSSNVILIAAYVALLMGCAAPVTEQVRTGFISDYSQLEKAGDTLYISLGPKVTSYSRFRIVGPEILFDPNTGKSDKFTDEEIEDLKQYFRKQLTKALTENDGFSVVEEPGEGIATIRLGVTALDASLGLLNIAVTTKITGAGLGGAAMEGEMVDSLTGEQLGAWIRWGSGSRVTRAGLTRLGDAKLQINRWTKDMRQRIDAVHNPEPSAAEAE